MCWYRISLFESVVCAGWWFYLHVSKELIYCLITGQPEQPGLVEGAHGRGIGAGWSFSTQIIPCGFLLVHLSDTYWKCDNALKGHTALLLGGLLASSPAKESCCLLSWEFPDSEYWMHIGGCPVWTNSWGKFALCCICLPYFINVHSFWGAERIIGNSSVRGIQSI